MDSRQPYTWVERQDAESGAVCPGRLAPAPGAIRHSRAGWEPGTAVAVEATGNWYGIVGESEQAGQPPRRGNKLARTTLVQCALIAQRYNPFLRRFYERIKRRRGAGKAIVATARKLLTIVYYTLKNHWTFTDFTTFAVES